MTSHSDLRYLVTSSTFVCAFVGIALARPVVAQTSHHSDTPAIKLQPYTAPDKSVSAGVPPGWTVTKGAETVIEMTGPKGETIFLGKTIVARNAPFQLGQAVSNGIDMSMPDSASLKEKLTMMVQQNAAIQHDPQPKLEITSIKNMSLPFAIGQCGRLAGNFAGQKGPLTFVALLCSMPVDTGGTYKVMVKLAQVPPAQFAEEKPLLTAVLRSYKVAPAMLRLKLAPFTAPPAIQQPGIPVGKPSPVVLTAIDCFDMAVLRETPATELPKECREASPQ